MNLIKRTIDLNTSNILQFREHQYALISELFEICRKYLQNFGFDPPIFEYESVDDYNYHTIQNHFSTKLVKIRIDPTDPKNYFLSISIPKLIDGSFFKLNGAMYVPIYYIVDSPIALKRKSILLYSLFKPITFNHDNRAVFLGSNIPTSRFLRLYCQDETELEHMTELLKGEYIRENMPTTLRNMASVLYMPPDLDKIKERIDMLFFDDWTKELYQKYYNIDPSMESLINLLVNKIKTGKHQSFIDLQHKRLVFVEFLLDPLFKAVSRAATSLIHGNEVNKLYMNMGEITKHFFAASKNTKEKGLQGDNFYSVVNGFSGLLSLKASFKNPKGMGNLPSEVSNIHPSFKGRICPVSISNTDPGVTVSLIPNQNIDLRYGIFQ